MNIQLSSSSLKDEKKYNLKCEEDRSLLMSLNENGGKYMDQLGAALNVGGKTTQVQIKLGGEAENFWK